MWTMGSRTGRRVAALMAASALLLLAGCSRKTDNFHSPSDPVVPPTASLGTITASPLQVATSGGNSIIAVEVKDLEGAPLAGVQVTFAASLGAISASAISDSLGVARAAFTAGSTSGFARITATLPGVSRALTLLVGEGTLHAEPYSALADGHAQILISGVVPQEDPSNPTARTVRFVTTAGTLSQESVVAGTDGSVSTYLTTTSSDQDVGVTVTLVDGNNPDLLLGGTLVVFRGITLALAAEDSLLIADGVSQTTISGRLFETGAGTALSNEWVTYGASRGSITAQVLSDDQGEAEATFTAAATSGPAVITASFSQNVRDTVTLTLTNVALTVTSATDTLVADGGSTTTISAWLGDPGTGTPIPAEDITFTTNLGTIEPLATTNGAGIATAALTASTRSGTCRVEAVYRGSVRGNCYIEFVRPTVAGVWLSIQPAQVLADGQSTVDVRAAVTLAGGVPAPDGTSVSFTSGAGVISPSSATSGGIAIATLTSSSQVLSQVPVIATAGALRDTAWVDFVPGGARSVLVTVSPDSLFADGTATATVTAQARDDVGHPVTDGTVITFTSDLGWIGTSALTENGYGTVLFTAATQAGSATITASVPNGTAAPTTGTVGVRLIASSDADDIILSTSRMTIGVAGGGGVETASIFADVRDKNGNRVPDGTNVSFLILSGPGGGEHLDSPATGVGPVDIPTTGGIARVSLTSGTRSGTVSVQATAGSVAHSATNVVITSGPPHNIRFTVEQGASTLESMSCLWTKLVTALVTDLYGNPVQDSTVIHYSLSTGARAVIEGSSGCGLMPEPGCDFGALWPSLRPVRGAAYTCLTYGSPDVFDNYWVYAQTSAGVTTITDSINVTNTLITPSISIGISPASVDSVSGGVVGVSATVTDLCGYYIDAASVVFSADAGVTFAPAIGSTTNGVAFSLMTVPAGTPTGTITVRARINGTGIYASDIVTVR